MTERPMLFSAPMVRALLDGSKTQTRRVIKPQPRFESNLPANLNDYLFHNAPLSISGYDLPNRCPHGVVGDRLWVKETFHRDVDHNQIFYRADAEEDGRNVPFLMDGAGGFGGGVATALIRRWTPSIFMPRSASRLTLEITDVWTEPLQSISEADAVAEGVEGIVQTGTTVPARVAYQALWQKINGAGSWAKNPWVWVISFRRAK